MLIDIVRMAWIIVLAALNWFFMLIRWIDRNPEWADQLRRNECPRPWFFKVWTVLFIAACICVGFLVCYYSVKSYLMIRGW